MAVNFVPSARGLEGVTVKLPLPSATAVPTSAPEPSVTITVTPGCAVPETVRPFVSARTGASGSGATSRVNVPEKAPEPVPGVRVEAHDIVSGPAAVGVQVLEAESYVAEPLDALSATGAPSTPITGLAARAPTVPSGWEIV